MAENSVPLVMASAVNGPDLGPGNTAGIAALNDEQIYNTTTKGTLLSYASDNVILLPANNVLKNYGILDNPNLFKIKMEAFATPTLVLNVDRRALTPQESNDVNTALNNAANAQNSQVVEDIATNGSAEEKQAQLDAIQNELKDTKDKATSQGKLSYKLDIEGGAIDPRPIASFITIHNEQTFSVIHSHEYGDDMLGGLANVANKAFEVIPGLNMGTIKNGSHFIKNIWGDHKDKNIGHVGTMEFGRAFTVGGFDIAPVYKSSAQRQITVSFVLFAEIDPWIEVVLPTQLLSYLSYPRLVPYNTMLALYKGLVELRAKLIQDATKTGGGIGGVLGSVNNIIGALGSNSQADFESKMKSMVEDSLKTIMASVDQSKGPNSFRGVAGSHPPIWRITTSNGLMNLNTAHLKDVNITYYGPWKGRPPQADRVGTILGGVQTAISLVKNAAGGGNAFGDVARSVYPNSVDTVMSVVKGLNSINNTIDMLNGVSKASNPTLGDGGLPSYAEVKLTFVSNFKNTYGEEILSSPGVKKTVTTNAFKQGVNIIQSLTR